MKRNFIFDYIFYRVVSAYNDWEGINGAVTSGVIFIVWVILFSLISIFRILLFFIHYSVFSPHSRLIGYIGLIVLTGLFIFIRSRFDNDRYQLLKKHWENESVLSKKIKGFCVILCFFASMILLAF